MKRQSKKLLALLTTACLMLGSPIAALAQAPTDSQAFNTTKAEAAEPSTIATENPEVPKDNRASDWIQVDSASEQITYTGTWVKEDGSHIGGSGMQANTSNSSAEFTFTGTGIRWIGQTDTNYGSAQIFIDGELVATPSANAPGKMSAEVYTLVGLENKEHVLKLVPVGPYHAERNWIELDALEYTKDSSPVEPDTLNVTPETVSLQPGGTKQLSVSVLKGTAHIYKSASASAISSDSAIAAIDSKTFLVTAIGAGTATITISAGNLVKTVTVDVKGRGELRMTIDNEHPLIIHHMAREMNPSNPQTPGPIQGGHNIVDFWKQIPENQLPYSAIVIHPGYYLNTDYAGHMEFLEAQIKIANDNKIPFFVMIGNSFTSNFLSNEKMKEYYDKYEYCMGSAYSELHSSKNRNKLSNEMADKIDLASQYGGFVWIADMNDEGDSVEVLVNNERFYNTAKANKENVILMSKTTSAWSNVSYNSYESVTYGAWLSEICNNYGSLIDSWMWFIESYWKLYEDPNGRIGSHGPEECRGAFAFPELLYPMRMLQESMSGATVYSFEHPFNSTGIRNQIGPVYNHAISKAIDYMLNEKIPTRDEMLAKTKIAYDSSNGSLSSLSNNGINLIGTLYGDGGNHGTEKTMLTQTTGRYGIVPSILPRAVSEFKEKHPDIQTVNLTDITSTYNSKDKILELFNSKYPENYTGDGFAYKLDNTWFAYNSKWQKEKVQNVSLPLNNNVNANITFDNYTYVLLKQQDGSYDIKLNNFLVDKNDIWEGYIESGQGETQHWDSDNNDMWPKYLLEKYFPDGVRRDETFRSTTITLTNQKAAPTVTVSDGMYDSGNKHNQYKDPVVNYNAATKEASITIESNGWLNFTVTENEASPVDKLKLNAQIQRAEGLNKALYTEDSWKVLETALTAAKQAAADTNATQATVDACTKSLEDAVNALKVKPVVDKTKLNAQIQSAQSLNKAVYTEDTWKALETALAAAKQAAADATATQATVDARTKALETAINALKKKPTQAELDAQATKPVIDKINNIKTVTLSRESTIKDAQTAYNKLTYSQKKLVTNYHVLTAAQKKLTELKAAAKFQKVKVTVTAKNADAKNISLSWKKVSDASGYMVMVKSSGKWKTIKDIKGSKTVSYKYTKATAGKSYTFAVKAYKTINGKKYYSKYNSVTKKAVPAAPSISAKAYKGYAKVTWKKTSGASSYTIMRKDGRTWKKVATAKSSATSFKDTKAKKGKSYSYKVCANVKSGKKTLAGSYSKTLTLKAK